MTEPMTVDTTEQGFSKIAEDLKFLMDCLEEVLREQGDNELADLLPWRENGQEIQQDEVFLDRLGQLYSIAFQMLNMVEENVSAQMRRIGESQSDDAYRESGLWDYQFDRLKELGVEVGEIRDSLKNIRVEPVLTAHPTEAKRYTVLEQHRQLYVLLVQRENQMWTPDEQDAIRAKIKVCLERLWRTGEVRISKPDVRGERSSTMYYLREVFPAVLHKTDQRLRNAWKRSGWDTNDLVAPESLPHLRFGTWVGGDRDGHPLVTAEVTRETFKELRIHALIMLNKQLGELPRKMSLSERRHSVPDRLLEEIKRMHEAIKEREHKPMHEIGEGEPWREFAVLIRARMPLHVNIDQRVELAEPAGSYRQSSELLSDLKILREMLAEVGAESLARNDLDPIIRNVQTFGFHLAYLDIRQNSSFHDKAMSQLIEAAGLGASNFGDWDEEERLIFLNRELRSPRPFIASGTELTGEAEAVLSCYRAVAEQIDKYGTDGVGCLIISMTQRLSDLLVVYVLAREAGLVTSTREGLVCKMPVVPLFETLDDLQRGPGIMKHFLAHPVTQRSLQYQHKQRAFGVRPIQPVMIGYSDSNKDSGILASQWGLHGSQKQISAAGEDYNVDIQFFHGRGGTISRGAGPTHRFLESLPPGTISGNFRLTEQGETISQKYANHITATYNLELLLAGVAGTSLYNRHAKDHDTRFEPIAEMLCNSSAQAYRETLHSEGFVDFYSQTTPIDALEHNTIGSRPSRRSGVRSLADLRAIPWVFSWNQSRYYFPGWFGVGTGLQELKEKHHGEFELLQKNIKNWSFMRYVLTNVETNLASADLDIMADYAGLVTDEELRNRFFGRISQEYKRTQSLLDEIFGGECIEVRRPRMLKTLKLREAALRKLHFQQVQLLKKWRELQANGQEAEASAMLPQLLLSVNAIAGGLRTTG